MKPFTCYRIYLLISTALLLFSHYVKNSPKVLVIGKASSGYDETFGDGGHICYRDCGDGFLGTFICQKLSSYTL